MSELAWASRHSYLAQMWRTLVHPMSVASYTLALYDHIGPHIRNYQNIGLSRLISIELHFTCCACPQHTTLLGIWSQDSVYGASHRACCSHTVKAALAKPEALSHHQAALSLQLLTKLLIFFFSFQCQTQIIERHLTLS